MDLELERAVARLPETCRDGFLNYLRYGLPPGQFLTAIFSNDLAEACARADEPNQRALYDYVFVLNNYAPIDAWGSRDKVLAWVERGRATRATSGGGKL